MQSLLAQKLQILVLGALFALGLALSAVHAAEMTMNPHPASGGCLTGATDGAGCDMGDDTDSMPAACSSICPAATAAIMGSHAELTPLGVYERQFPRHAPYASIIPAPDPAPPKIIANC